MPTPSPGSAAAVPGPADGKAPAADMASPPTAEGAAAQSPVSSPEAPVDTLKSQPDSSPAAAAQPLAAAAGGDMSGSGAVPAGAPSGGAPHTDRAVTAYQALLSGAYLRDLVSMEPKEHSTFAWVINITHLLLTPPVNHSMQHDPFVSATVAIDTTDA